MTFEEAEQILNEFKDKGVTDEELAGALYMMYSQDKLTLEELRNLISILGYEFTDEFEALPEEEKKKPENALKDKDEPAEGVDKEDIEDAKEVEDEEEDEGEMKKLFGLDKGEDEGEEEDEDDEEMKKLFGLDKSKKK